MLGRVRKDSDPVMDLSHPNIIEGKQGKQILVSRTLSTKKRQPDCTSKQGAWSSLTQFVARGIAKLKGNIDFENDRDGEHTNVEENGLDSHGTRKDGIWTSADSSDCDFESDNQWRCFVNVSDARFRSEMGWERLGARARSHLRDVIFHLIHPVPRHRMALPRALSNLEDALVWCTDD